MQPQKWESLHPINCLVDGFSLDAVLEKALVARQEHWHVNDESTPSGDGGRREVRETLCRSKVLNYANRSPNYQRERIRSPRPSAAPGFRDEQGSTAGVGGR